MKEILAAGGYATVLTIAGQRLQRPQGVAVDGSGNVFVADDGNNAVKEILAAGGYTTVNTLGSGFSLPTGVAVDGSGNVFVADCLQQCGERDSGGGWLHHANTIGQRLQLSLRRCGGRERKRLRRRCAASAVKEILAAGGYTTVITLASGFAQLPMVLRWTEAGTSSSPNPARTAC